MARLALLRATEIWVILLAVLATLVSSQAYLLIIALFLCYRLLQWWSTGALTIRTPIDLPIILLLIGPIPLTLWATVQPEVTYLEVYRLLSGVSLLYTLVNGIRTQAALHYCISGLMTVGMALALLAPFTVEWITDKFSFIPLLLYTLAPLLASDQIHPNVIAGALAFLLPLALALLFFGWRQLAKTEKVLYGFAAVTMGLILLFTQSRGALTALTVAMLFLLLLRWRWGWLMAVATLGIIMFALSLGYQNLIIDSRELATVRGWEGRQEIWSRALAIIQDFPFTGIGMGNFDLIASTFYPFFLAAPGQTPHAHQLFLQIGVDLGIPGLVIWLSMLFITLLVSWQLFQNGMRTDARWFAGLGAGLLGSQLALLTHGLTDAVLWGTKPALLLWFIWGTALAAAIFYQRSAVKFT